MVAVAPEHIILRHLRPCTCTGPPAPLGCKPSSASGSCRAQGCRISTDGNFGCTSFVVSLCRLIQNGRMNGSGFLADGVSSDT
eukprot:scaffold16859_cov140-Isochrysis_galbana.AAC.2